LIDRLPVSPAGHPIHGTIPPPKNRGERRKAHGPLRGIRAAGQTIMNLKGSGRCRLNVSEACFSTGFNDNIR